MTSDAVRRAPVILSVADLRNNAERRVELAAEPLELAARAIRAALASAPSGTAELIDALSVVNVVSWAYDDLPGLIAQRCGLRPRLLEHTDVGGNRPVELLDRASARVSRAETRVEVICGAESARSLAVLAAAGVEAPWTRQPGGPARPDKSKAGSARMWQHGVVGPPRVYPLYENRLRYDLGQSFDEAQRWSGQMYADFSGVAAGNPAAWDGTVRTAHEIVAVSDKNRLIHWPYPLRMNAMPTVDQAAALLVTTAETALQLGANESDLVYVRGAAGGADSADVLDRAAYGRAPALEAVLDTVLDRTEITPHDIDAYDLYSCFPIVPKIASLHLGLGRHTRLTQTGGLAAFGGPANNYSTHALVATTHAIRRGATTALVYANGEYLTKHHAVVLSRTADPRGYRTSDSLVTPHRLPIPPFREQGRGTCRIETFTVEFDRQGKPTRGLVIVRDRAGFRLVGRAEHPATLAWLTDPSAEPIGATGCLEVDADGRTSFFHSEEITP